MSKRSDKEEQGQHDIKMSQDTIESEDNSMERGSRISTLNKHNYVADYGLKQVFHCFMFQLKLLMLFLLRGVRKNYSFLLATEMDAAEQFDDVIFQYDNERKDGIIYRFLQAKHKYDESKKIKAVDLQDGKRGQFSLIKYFLSYIKIIRNPEFKEKNSEFKDFIICTNIDLEEDLQKHFEQIEDEDDILDMQPKDKNQKRLKFKNGNFAFKETLIEEITKNTKKTNPDYDFTNIKDDTQSFLEKLVFALNLPNEIELGKIIEDEIGEIFNNVDKKNVYGRFQLKMMDWMKTKQGKFISNEDGTHFFDELRIEILGNIWFNVKDPVQFFTGRNKELLKLHETLQRSPKASVVSQITSVTGLGGIGKSELARKYAKEYNNKYNNNVLWINAENLESLSDSFFNLAKDNRLGIHTQDKDGKEKKIEDIVKEVYGFFTKKKSLFIFDNADTNYDLVRFLPICLSTAAANRPYVLITSRNQAWEKEIEVIKLNELELSDAIEFVKRRLDVPTDDKSKDQVIEELVKKLQCFPLAIHQAIAFVEDEGVTRKFEINDYLKLYEKMEKDLLSSDVFQGIGNDYNKTTFNTWKITIARIQADEQCGQLAMKILNIVSYFAPENIYRQIFINLADGNEKLLNSAVRLLVKYSMINGVEYQSVLNIHRLVQQVTRINIKDENKEEKIVEEVFQLLKINFPRYSDKVVDHKKKRHLLPHLEMFLSHIDNLIENKPDDKQRMEKHYIEDLFDWIFEVHFDFDELYKKKDLLERCLKMKEKNYGPYNFNIVKTLGYLGSAYGVLGHLQKQKELLERALKINEMHYGPDNFNVAGTLENLGNAYGDLGDYEKRKDLLERALKINEMHYGPDNVNVAGTLESLGNAYGDLGDYEKQKDLLERALKINELHYGADNFNVARTLGNLGNMYGNLGDLQKQKELLERALKINEMHYGSDNFNVARTLVNLGNAYGDLGDYEKRRDLLEQALIINEMHYGPYNFNVARTLENLGNAYGVLGHLQKRKELLERALKINEMHYGPDNFNVARTLVNLGNAYGALGDAQKKIELVERALKINEIHYGSNYKFNVATTLANLGNAYRALGYDHKAYELYEKSSKIIWQQKPLHMAIRNENLGTVKYILQKGAHVLARNSHDTVLHQAIASGEEEVILLILKKIKDRYNGDAAEQLYESINAKDTEGDTPLMWAAETAKINIAKILLEYGADINAIDLSGQTALHAAVEKVNLEFVQLLLKNYADHTILDYNKKTPLKLAQEKFAQDTENKDLKEIIHTLSNK